MIQQGFSIGDNDWRLTIYYDVRERNLNEVYHSLLANGCDNHRAQRACMVLSRPDKGYTYTNFDKHTTIVFISRTTDAEQMYDSIQHETKHVVEHISEYYDVDPKSEESAYLQGEIARLMFPAAVIVACPMCNHVEK